MKVTIQPGRIVRLTARKNSSSRGGTYDLDALKLSDSQQKAILDCPGVSEHKPSAKSAGKDGAK